MRDKYPQNNNNRNGSADNMGPLINCITDSGENRSHLIDTYSTEYISYTIWMFNAFEQLPTMMMMMWCNVPTSKYDPTAITHSIICTHHRLPTLWTVAIRTRTQLSRNRYKATDSTSWYSHFRHTAAENIAAMGKVGTSNLMMIMIRWSHVTNDLAQCLYHSHSWFIKFNLIAILHVHLFKIRIRIPRFSWHKRHKKVSTAPKRKLNHGCE